MNKLLSIILLSVVFFASAQDTAAADDGCYDVVLKDGGVLKLCPGGVMAPAVDADTQEPLSVLTTASLEIDLNVFWILLCSILVFFMQTGFGMLEAGCIGEKNVSNILFKNLMDAAVGAMAFWLFGYAFAYGGDGDNVFIGTTNFALSNMDDADYHNFFFQWAFAATASTIVSGAVAERVKLSAYFVYAFVITAFIYPVVVHWVWDSDGWLSAFNDDVKMLTNDPLKSNGMIDFAGCGVVHMVGGVCALIGAIFVGPRMGRFEPAVDQNGIPIVVGEHNKLAAALGCTILWTAWYGFNCGSTLAIVGMSGTAARVAVTTTLGAASGSITCMLICKFTGKKEFSLMMTLNGVLAGLVSITAACPVIEPWAAVVIGAIGAVVYLLSSNLLASLKIDDPLDAAPIHMFCGAWGCIAVGIFSEYHLIQRAYPSTAPDAMSSGAQLATQVVGVLVIFAWTATTSAIMFGLIKMTIGLRVDEETERMGLDVSEHGGAAFLGGSATQMVGVPKKEPAPAPAAATGDVTVHVDEKA